jgi:hypothetical protein
MQDRGPVPVIFGSDFEEELSVLLSIYDSDLHVDRKTDGSVVLSMKISPAPPAYISARIFLHIPLAVRAYSSHILLLVSNKPFQGKSTQLPSVQCELFGSNPILWRCPLCSDVSSCVF